MFLSPRALKKYYISLNLCILVSRIRNHSKIALPMSSKKVIWVGFGFSNFFSTTRNDRIFFISRALKKYYVSINLCLLVGYTSKQPKIGVSMFSKKIILVGFGFSNFFRLLESTEFFFLLGLLKSYISAWTHVFWLVIQENTRKFGYQCPQKNLFGSVSGSRIFFDYSNQPNFSFF